MKKIAFAFIIATLCLHAKPIEIQSLKWTKDYETLVHLSMKTQDTIEGIDTNNNGIRDDVEYYVQERYKDSEFQKNMYLSAAKKIQQILTLPKEAPIQTRVKLDKELINLYTCNDYILYKNSNIDIKTQMRNKSLFKSKVLNSKIRLEAYIEHKKLLPFSFDDLSEEQLNKDKAVCNILYHTYENKDYSQLISNLKN
jgi:hypothetical protein